MSNKRNRRGRSRELEVLNDRAEREHWEERQRADQQDGAGEQGYEQPTSDRKARWPRRNALLFGHIACDREHRDDRQEAPEQHADGERQRIEDRMICGVCGEPRKWAAVVGRRRTERIQDLGKSVRMWLPRRASHFARS